MRCPKCGLEEDRDIIAVRNLLKLRDLGFIRSPRRPYEGRDES
jgi:transposase